MGQCRNKFSFPAKRDNRSFLLTLKTSQLRMIRPSMPMPSIIGKFIILYGRYFLINLKYYQIRPQILNMKVLFVEMRYQQTFNPRFSS